MDIDGNGKSRDKFLKEIRKALRSFLGYENRELIMVLSEMVKNIYDHTDEKKGALRIEKYPDLINFSLRDQGTEEFLWGDCIRKSTKAGNGINFGVGLRSIEDISCHIGLKLEIDTSKGFAYTGSFRPIR